MFFFKKNSFARWQTCYGVTVLRKIHIKFLKDLVTGHGIHTLT
jgi:hypothetical protein